MTTKRDLEKSLERLSKDLRARRSIESGKESRIEALREKLNNLKAKDIETIKQLKKSKKEELDDKLPEEEDILDYEKRTQELHKRLLNADNQEVSEIKKEYTQIKKKVDGATTSISRNLITNSLTSRIITTIAALSIAGAGVLQGYRMSPIINQTPKTISRLEKQVDNLEGNYWREFSNAKGLEKENYSLEEQNEILNDGLRTKKDRVTELEDYNEQLDEKVAKLTEENDLFSQGNEGFKRRIDQLDQDKKGLSTLITEQETQLGDRDAQISTLNLRLQTLQTEYREKLGEEFEPRLAMLYTLAQEVSGERPENFSQAMVAIQSNRGAIVSSKREAEQIYSVVKEIFESDLGTPEEIRELLGEKKENLVAARTEMSNYKSEVRETQERVATNIRELDTKLTTLNSVLGEAREEISTYQTSEREMVRLLKKKGLEVDSLASYVEQLRTEEENNKELTTEQKEERFEELFNEIYGVTPSSPELALYAIQERLLREKGYFIESGPITPERLQHNELRNRISQHKAERGSILATIASLGPAVSERNIKVKHNEEFQLIKRKNNVASEPITNMDEFEALIEEKKKSEMIRLSTEVVHSSIRSLEDIATYYNNQIPEDEIIERADFSVIKNNYLNHLKGYYTIIFDSMNPQLPEGERLQNNSEDLNELETKVAEVLSKFKKKGLRKNNEWYKRFSIATQKIKSLEKADPEERHDIERRPLAIDSLSDRQIEGLEKAVNNLEYEVYFTSKLSNIVIDNLEELFQHLGGEFEDPQLEDPKYYEEEVKNNYKASDIMIFFKDSLFFDEEEKNVNNIKGDIKVKLQERYGENWEGLLIKKMQSIANKVEREAGSNVQEHNSLQEALGSVVQIFQAHNEEYHSNLEMFKRYEDIEIPSETDLEFLKYDLNPEDYVFTKELFVYRFAEREGVIKLNNYETNEELRDKFTSLGLPDKEGIPNIHVGRNHMFYIWENGDIKIWNYTQETKWKSYVINSNLEGKIKNLTHDKENIYWTAPEGHNCAFRGKLSEQIAARINEYNEAKTAGDSEGRLRSDFSDLIRVYNVGEEPWDVRARLEARPSISTGVKNLGRSISSGANSIKEGFKWLINPFIPARNERGIFMNNRYGMSVSSLHMNSLPPSVASLVGNAKDKEIEAQRWYGPEISLVIPYNERVYFELGGKLDVHGKIKGPNFIEGGSNFDMERRSDAKYIPFLTPFGKLIVQQDWLSKWLNARAALVCGINPTQMELRDANGSVVSSGRGMNEFIGLEILKGEVSGHEDLSWYFGAHYSQDEVRFHGRDSKGNSINEGLFPMYGWGVSAGLVVEWPSPNPNSKNTYYQTKKEFNTQWTPDKNFSEGRLWLEIGTRHSSIEYNHMPLSLKEIMVNKNIDFDVRDHKLVTLGFEYPSHFPIKLFTDYGVHLAEFEGDPRSYNTTLDGAPNLKEMNKIRLGPTIGVELSNSTEFNNTIVQIGLRAAYNHVDYDFFDTTYIRKNSRKIVKGEGDRWRFSLNLELKDLHDGTFSGSGMFFEVSYDTERINFERMNSFGNNAPDGNYSGYGWGLGFGYKIPLYPWYEK